MTNDATKNQDRDSRQGRIPGSPDTPAVATERTQATSAAYAQQEAEWNRAYDDAMQWRDWQTCEILIDEREQADWWKGRDHNEDA